MYADWAPCTAADIAACALSLDQKKRMWVEKDIDAVVGRTHYPLAATMDLREVISLEKGQETIWSGGIRVSKCIDFSSTLKDTSFYTSNPLLVLENVLSCCIVFLNKSRHGQIQRVQSVTYMSRKWSSLYTTPYRDMHFGVGSSTRSRMAIWWWEIIGEMR